MHCGAERTREALDKECARQESRLAVLWTIGVFALNFGPVIVGGVLDFVGPKLTSILGEYWQLYILLDAMLLHIEKWRVAKPLRGKLCNTSSRRLAAQLSCLGWSRC